MKAAEPMQKSSVIFMDETGALYSDRIFGVGIVKCPTPAIVQRPFQLMRDKYHFYGEIKWNALDRKALLPLYKEAVESFFRCSEATFACFVADKATSNPVLRFGNHWRA